MFAINIVMMLVWFWFGIAFGSSDPSSHPAMAFAAVFVMYYSLYMLLWRHKQMQPGYARALICVYAVSFVIFAARWMLTH